MLNNLTPEQFQQLVEMGVIDEIQASQIAGANRLAQFQRTEIFRQQQDDQAWASWLQEHDALFGTSLSEASQRLRQACEQAGQDGFLEGLRGGLP